MFEYITTPIFYVNDKPHLGHLYVTVAGDILARFARMLQKEVKFLSGTDEHGSKVAQSAAGRGESVHQYVDSVSAAFRDMTSYANASLDDFIRTTEPRHHTAAQALWKELNDRGQIYISTYSGWYAVRDEAFYDETELTDTVNGKIAPTGAPVEWVDEPCYFFRLSHWQDALLKHYKDHPDAIAPESRYNETVSFINGGLNDLAISRSKVEWGISVPDSSCHVMYVWIDALTNYITALGYPNRCNDDFRNFWPASLHLIGKDILRFHTVYWPAFLMAAGLALPKRIFAHGWWTRDGQKMSKSLGNVVDPKLLIDIYGIDPVRYFLFRQVRFGQDGDFSEHLFVQRINQELADGLGNLACRVLSFLQIYLNGMIPSINKDEYEDDDLYMWGSKKWIRLIAFIHEQDIFHYLEEVFHGVQLGNQFMTKLAPWELVKSAINGDLDRKKEMETGLALLVNLIKDLAVLFWPIMPQSCENLLSQLGIDCHNFAPSQILALLEKPIVNSKKLPAPSPLFKKICTDSR